MKELAIGGMSCAHCVGSVTQALEAVEGVSQVQVDLATGTAVLHLAADVTEKQLQEAVEAVGFEAGELKEHVQE